MDAEQAHFGYFVQGLCKIEPSDAKCFCAKSLQNTYLCPCTSLAYVHRARRAFQNRPHCICSSPKIACACPSHMTGWRLASSWSHGARDGSSSASRRDLSGELPRVWQGPRQRACERSRDSHSMHVFFTCVPYPRGWASELRLEPGSSPGRGKSI